MGWTLVGRWFGGTLCSFPGIRFVLFWTVLLLLSCFVPTGSGSADDLYPDPDPDLGPNFSSALTSEGSGHGSFLDALGFTDDEDSYNYGGGDYGDSYDDTHIHIGDLTIRCFHCLGDGNTGCDVVAMLADVEKHTVMCLGKCLNISDGPTAVYNCANDMSSRFDTCLENSGTQMCFCSGDYCNSPGTDIDIFRSHDPALILNADEDNNNGTDDIFNIRGGSVNGSNTDQDMMGSDQNQTASSNEISLGSNPSLSMNESHKFKHRHPLDRFPFLFKTETDVIIPLRSSGGDESSNSFEESSSSVSVNSAAVGNLRDKDAESCAPLRASYIPSLFSISIIALISCVRFSL
ncbi:uncharacterized protein LOC106012315 [Aplysia californica]|uniref:Uncharacterized protein LOC106012315 n=1 Tax=Aplysia californica TaxID=6500 RepID=A0ABM1A402_APLCA|nr:uncharacterized protein LOC106012315 [Aplysia californica]